MCRNSVGNVVVFYVQRGEWAVVARNKVLGTATYVKCHSLKEARACGRDLLASMTSGR